MVYTSKEAIVKQMRAQLSVRSDIRKRALLCIFQNQTFDEQKSESTNKYNGVGFTGADAPLLSSFAKQLKYKGYLSEKQDAILKRKIIKYARQLVNGSIAEGKIREVNGKYVW